MEDERPAEAATGEGGARAVPPLSIFIIARDEADRIGATIRAAACLTDDLVVVDSGSQDATVAVARELGARVLHRDWEGYGPQKRFAEEQCRHDWVLNLDADEVVPPELAAEIRALFEHPAGPERDGYRIGIAEVFPGEAAPHRFAYTLRPVRLYRRSRGRYNPSPVHDRVDMAEGARVGSLRGVLHHFSVRSLGDQIAKLHRYSDQQAEDLEARGIVIPTWRVVVEFQAAFWKAYIGRRHFVRGAYGFLTAMNYAIARHMRMAKHYERSRKIGREATAPSVDRPEARP
jgi:glycosyltransferase involved in cell wall biosynthesis